jgi:type IV pilus assembly protein PilV
LTSASSKLPKPRAAGFSAVELMVSITVMALLMLGFLTVFPLGMRSVQKGENLSTATSLAQDEMERLKTLPYTDAALTAGNHADPGNPIEGLFTRTWNVTNDAPMAGMKTVTVTVVYRDGVGPRNIQMTTYLTR